MALTGTGLEWPGQMIGPSARDEVDDDDCDDDWAEVEEAVEGEGSVVVETAGVAAVVAEESDIVLRVKEEMCKLSK